MKYFIYLLLLLICILFGRTAFASEFRIVKGKDAQRVPHQVALMQDGGLECGGSLIGPRTVLTAGHCVFFNVNDTEAFKIHYGSLFYENGTVVGVSKIVVHPLFKYYKEPEYDLAIVHLNESIRLGPNAGIIALANSTPPAGSALEMTGWGKFNERSTFSPRLQLADSMRVVNQTECQVHYPKIHITRHILCAQSVAGQGTCKGDSGGPLTQSGVLVGVSSFAAPNCADLSLPDGFADVASMRDWIDKNISL